MEYSVHHTERELLEQLSAGDRAAFTRIYKEYYPGLYRYLFVVTKSAEASEEILQDVFLKLWIKRTSLTGVISLKNYLFRMARNRVFDLRRKDVHRDQYLKTITTEDKSNNDVFDTLLLKEYHQVVQDGITRMPDRRQKIFLMNAREELTAREIAERLNLSLGVVKKQLYEAQQYLRKYLENHGDMLFVVMFVGGIY